jgi:4-hydroxybenzoate polyprenyltransferase
LVQLIAYFRLFHPYTSLAVAFTAVILSLPLSNVYQSFDVIIFGFIILIIQFTIGGSNDIFDLQLDAITKPWKPLPSGAVNPQIAKGILIFLIVITLRFSFYFGGLVQIMFLIGLGCGLVYNLGLKRTFLSWLPLSMALPLLFITARLVSGRFLMIHLWSFPISFLLGPAINLANQLPDFERIIRHEKSLLYYCGNVRRGEQIAIVLLVLSSLAIPVIAVLNNLNYSIALISGIFGIILSIIFSIMVKLDKKKIGFPIAFLITVVLASGFLISVE